MPNISISSIESLVVDVLQHVGVPKNDARIVADSIVYAHQREKGTHGIGRLHIYIRKIREGLMSPDTPLKVVKEGPVVSVLDAGNGFGQVAAIRGMRRAMDAAGRMGLGVVGIRHSNNFGTAGFIAEEALKRDMIGIVLSNSAPAISPTGGNRPLFGTNPLAVAFPVAPPQLPIVLDMASSVAARGKIRQAARNGDNIPFGWALDKDGQPTDKPLAALAGSMLPIGGAKGYGLALVIDVLAGMLTGSAFAGFAEGLNHPSKTSNYGHLLLAIDPNSFLPAEEYRNNMETLIRRVKQCGNDGAVRLPGEASLRKQSECSDNVLLSDTEWNSISTHMESILSESGSPTPHGE